MAANSNQTVVEVTAADLPLFCSAPSTAQWAGHPRVYLPVEETGEIVCPYCSVRYKFTGEPSKGHH